MAIDHSSCDHPRTPAGRARCRADLDRFERGLWIKAQGKPGAVERPRRGDHTGGTRPVRQRGAQPRQRDDAGQVWVQLGPAEWPTLDTGDPVIVITKREGSVVRTLRGTLAADVVSGGYASVDLGTDARGTWRGVRHAPYDTIEKIMVPEPS